MAAGGITETIWHFAGYLHLIQEVAVARDAYEEFSHQRSSFEFVQIPRDPYDLPLPEEFGSTPLRVPLLRQGDPIVFSQPAIPVPAQPTTDWSPAEMSLGEPSFPKFARGGGGAGAPDFSELVVQPSVSIRFITIEPIEPKIQVTYEIGGIENLIEINQLNRVADGDVMTADLSDNDYIGVVSGSGVENLNGVDVAEALEAMVDEAEAETPADLNIPHNTMDLITFTEARDAARAAREGEPHEATVAPGRYVDGELTTVAEFPDPEIVPPEAVERDFPSKGIGQEAGLGDNAVFNVAGIVDANELAWTMIVLGDYFETDAIVQANVYRDDDDVSLAAGPTVNDVLTGGNVSHNVANFVETAGFAGGPFAGLTWNVDVVEGDFFDVKLLTQTNYLDDGDITVQANFESYFRVRTGDNQLINLADVFNLEQYDLIVIGGSYHKTNLIFQKNIILDNDVVKIAADGTGNGAPFQSVWTGQNYLLNDATIENIGGQVTEVTPGMADLAEALGNSESELALSFGFEVQGNGTGVLNVLYITGDYFDLNTIDQTNIIADMDTAIQFLPAAGLPSPDAPVAETAAADGSETDSMAPTTITQTVTGRSPDDGVTQSAATGGNEAVNTATIIDVSPNTIAVGGTHYSDTILVQAEIISDDDAVVYGDPNALVSEVIAFTGAPDDVETSDPAPGSTVASGHDDVMGQVLT